MGSVCSRISVIDALHFEAMPTGRVIKMVRVIRVNDHWFGVDACGRIYTDQINAKYAYAGLRDGSAISLVKALVKLEVISQRDADSFVAEQKASNQASTRKYAAQALLHNAKEAEVTLTKAQLKKLNELAGKKEP